MNKKKTYKQLFELNIIIGSYIKKHTDNKLCEALKKFAEKQLSTHFEDYNDQVDDLQRNNCLTDDTKKGAIMKDEKGNRIYSIAGEFKLKTELKELAVTQVDIHSRIVEGIDDLIKDLTEQEKEAFEGIVI